MISTIDIVVFDIARFFSVPLEELWIALAQEQILWHIKIHKIAAALGQRKSEALAFFHAFTGCDTISYFANKGKISAWKTVELFPEITSSFHTYQA